MPNQVEESGILFGGLPCIRLKEEYLVFSPYVMKLLKLALNDINQESIKNELRKIGFFGKPLSDIYNQEDIKITLVTTTDCNLRCKYCYLDAGGATQQYMSSQTALNALKGMVKLKPNAQGISVNFFGGEPTLNIDVVKNAVNFVKETQIKGKFHISTNGIMPVQVLGYLIDNEFQLTVSMDGTPGINDKYRVFENGVGTSKIVEKAIDKLVESKSHFNIRMTITDANVANIPKAIVYFSSLGAKYVHLELVNAAGRAIRNELQQPDYDQYYHFFVQGVEEAEKHNTYIINSVLMNLLTPSTFFCISVKGGMFIITPAGNITLCYQAIESNPFFKKFCLGYVASHGLKINSKKLRVMSNIGIETSDECKDCFAKFICSSGCPLRNMVIKAKKHNSLALCNFRRKMVYYAILQLYYAGRKGKVSPVLGTSLFENCKIGGLN